MNDYQKKTIVIKEAKESDDGTRIYVKDQDAIVYSFFKEYQGVPQDTYLQWQSGNHGAPFTMGSAATVSYKEKPNPKGGVFRNLYSIFPSAGVPASQPTQVASQPQKPVSGPYNAPQGKPERDFEKEAVGKCQYGFLEAYIRSGHSFQEAKLQVIPARKLAELVVYGTQQTTTEELPTIQVEGDLAGDYNPMINDEPPIEAFGEDIPY